MPELKNSNETFWVILKHCGAAAIMHVMRELPMKLKKSCNIYLSFSSLEKFIVEWLVNPMHCFSQMQTSRYHLNTSEVSVFNFFMKEACKMSEASKMNKASKMSKASNCRKYAKARPYKVELSQKAKKAFSLVCIWLPAAAASLA